ncbi:MAG: exonuclease domain-containing protein [Elusimicrobiota bacterium]|nr:exonuclease domain-containing protein [Elusimicrobiota bacterium]
MFSLLGSFPDMDKAVSILNDTVSKGERIAIITDSDVDGLSSLLILDDALNGADTSLFVCGGPAHGINAPDIKAVLKSKPRLVITADVGISEHEASKAFREHGIKFIITDHHHPCGKTAPADAVIDSCLANPAVEIAGCAAAFCLAASYQLSQKEDFSRIKIACDTETTGLSPSQNEIIEIGAVKFSGLKVIDRFSSLLKPLKRCINGKLISGEISSLTGISNLELEGAPEREVVLGKFREWIGGDTLIFHNAPFDKSFIDNEFRKYLGAGLTNNTIDTLPMSRIAMPSQSHKLDSLKDFFGITAVSHRALPDAEVAGKLYMILTHFESPAFRVFTEQNLPLAALGTLSDNIALKGISRALVKKHLAGIFNMRKYPVRTLLKKLGISRKNLRRDLTLKLIPFLNTPKRMGEPRLALDILKADSKKDISAAMGRVKELSDTRQNKMRIAFAGILSRIRENGLIKNPVIMLKAEKLPEGLRGPAASRISQMFKKPSIVFTRPANADSWTASARGAGYDMLEAFRICGADAEFGGHPGACGIRIKSGKLDKFIKDCGDYFKKITARKTTSGAPPGHSFRLKTDMLWDGWLAKNIENFLNKLEPFGNGNPAPVFLADKISCVTASPKGTKFLLRLKKNDKILSIISGEDPGRGVMDVAFTALRRKKRIIYFLKSFKKQEE